MPIGNVLSFVLNILRDFRREKRQERKFFEVLLSHLEYNKELVKKNTELGYHTMDYIDAEGAKYLLNLPKQLRDEIYNIRTKIALLSNPSYIFAKSQIIEALNNLLDKAIPQLKKYLKVK